jgi:hypothetical protein
VDGHAEDVLTDDHRAAFGHFRCPFLQVVSGRGHAAQVGQVSIGDEVGVAHLVLVVLED